MVNFKWWENYDVSVEINHNQNCPYIPDHPYRISIIGGFGKGKTNVLLNLKKHQQEDIDKMYLYVKNPFKSKYQLVISGRKKWGSVEKSINIWWYGSRYGVLVLLS